MKNPLGEKKKITVSPNTGPKGGNLKEAINLQVFRQVISKSLWYVGWVSNRDHHSKQVVHLAQNSEVMKNGYYILSFLVEIIPDNLESEMSFFN